MAERPPRWLSIPLILTSHTWENGKNEQSHQHPSLAEALLGELSPVSRVVFPADFNTADAVTGGVYQTRGQIWTVVVPKADHVPDLFTGDEAARILADGGLRLDWAGHAASRAKVALVAVGAYQLGEVLAASRRLAEREVAHTVVYLLEPGRFRRPRSAAEQAHQAPAVVREALFPEEVRGLVLVTHTRPELMRGLLAPFHSAGRTGALGYIGEGGTYDTPGLLFVNRSSWAHCLAEVARVLGLGRETLLGPAELDVLDGRTSPHGVVIPKLPHDPDRP